MIINNLGNFIKATNGNRNMGMRGCMRSGTSNLDSRDTQDRTDMGNNMMGGDSLLSNSPIRYLGLPSYSF